MVVEEAKANETTAEALTPVPVKLPLNLMKLIGYLGNARYVALYYMGSKAAWNDGRSSCTFSYYMAYQPLIDHPVMALHLLDADLGSDEAPPTHALICDRELRTFFLGDWEQALQFVANQERESPSAEELEELRELFDSAPTASQMQQRGMFELFMKPDASTEHERMLLLQWLDGLITEDVVVKTCRLFKSGDLRVWPQVEYLKRLVERFKSNQAANAQETAE